MNIELAKCRMCNAKLNGDTFMVREMMLGTRDEFEYQKCQLCESLQIRNIPKNLEAYYPDNYYSMAPNRNSIPLKDRFRKNLVTVGLKLYFFKDGALRSFLPAPKRGDLLALATAGIRKKHSILDVGCGSNPDLLIKLSKSGFSNLTGADPFIKGEPNLYRNIKLLKCDISEVEGAFDVVLMNHSLEHVVDPQKDLSALGKILKPEGIGIVRLPTTSAEVYEVYGADWVQLDAPRHLNLPSRKALEGMVSKAGLSIVNSYDDSTEFQFYGSELYQRDIALQDPKAKEVFSPKERKEFRKKAKELNTKRHGDQVAYILSHKS